MLSYSDLIDHSVDVNKLNGLWYNIVSIGKSTLAQEWCKKHVEYARIDEVARDIMKSSSLTRDDLTASIQTDKRVFLGLQLQIIEEQYRRVSELTGRPFVSDRGPDPIVYAALHADQTSADRLCAHAAAAACFQRYRTDCMVVILCPLPAAVDDGFQLVPESREKQDQFNNSVLEGLARCSVLVPRRHRQREKDECSGGHA